MRNFFESIAAGVLIGMGGVSFLTLKGIPGALLFSLGLFVIVMFQLKLFTGKCGLLVSSKNKLGHLMTLVQIWFGNLIGTGLVALAVSNVDKFNFDVSTMVNQKINSSPLSLVILGIFCGVLMHIAVQGFARTKNPLIIVLPVVTFILCGYEHCIADMFYFALSDVSTFDALYALIWITIGNAIGGNLVELIINKDLFKGERYD